MPTLPKAIICDIDGTLAHMTTRKGHPYDWHRVQEDEPDEVVIGLVNILAGKNITVILFSGRDSICREGTTLWLDEHNVAYNHLFMRSEKDNRKDSIVKQELYQQNVQGQYDVLFVLDDRDQVVSMWRNELGLKCLQVAEGDF